MTAPLDPWTARRIEQRNNRRMYALVLIALGLWFFGVIR